MFQEFTQIQTAQTCARVMRKVTVKPSSYLTNMTKPRRGESHIICTFFSFKTSELRRCRHGIASIIPPKTVFLGARHCAAYPTWELLVLKHLNAPLPVKCPSRRELLGNTCPILPSSFGLVRIRCHAPTWKLRAVELVRKKSNCLATVQVQLAHNF